MGRAARRPAKGSGARPSLVRLRTLGSDPGRPVTHCRRGQGRRIRIPGGVRVMRVSVFGLGYVGSVSAASFAADGHTVIGVDVNPDKVASLNEGRSPIVEKGLDELIRTAAANGSLRATADTVEAVNRTDLSLLCVGTPSRKNGSLDLSYLERVCQQIGEALKAKADYHVVVVRSTVLPGTTHDVVIPAIERTSGKT